MKYPVKKGSANIKKKSGKIKFYRFIGMLKMNVPQTISRQPVQQQALRWARGRVNN